MWRKDILSLKLLNSQPVIGRFFRPVVDRSCVPGVKILTFLGLRRFRIYSDFLMTFGVYSNVKVGRRPKVGPL